MQELSCGMNNSQHRKGHGICQNLQPLEHGDIPNPSGKVRPLSPDLASIHAPCLISRGNSNFSRSWIGPCGNHQENHIQSELGKIPGWIKSTSRWSWDGSKAFQDGLVEVMENHSLSPISPWWWKKLSWNIPNPGIIIIP